MEKDTIRKNNKKRMFQILFIVSVVFNVVLAVLVFRSMSGKYQNMSDDAIVSELVQFANDDRSRYEQILGQVRDQSQPEAVTNDNSNAVVDSGGEQQSPEDQLAAMEKAINQEGGKTFINYVSAAKLAKSLNDQEKLDRYRDEASKLLPAENDPDRQLGESIINSI